MTDGKTPYEKDLKDLADVLARILSKDTKFIINDQITSPFKLFKLLHKDLFLNIMGNFLYCVIYFIYIILYQ
jgi:hypothetical protein